MERIPAQVHRTYLVILSLAAFIFLIYFPTLHFGFVSYDDPEILLNNNFVQNFQIKTLLTSVVARDYIPVTLLSFSLENFFFGLSPFVFHLNNVILHILNSFLVYILLRKLFDLEKNWLIAFLMSAVFAAHPLRVESVAWVTERKDVLFTFFYLLAIIFYLKSETKKYWLRLSVLAFLLALFSKFMAVSLPFVLLATDWLRSGKITSKIIKNKRPYLGLSALAAAIQITLHESVTIESGSWLNPIWSLVFYLSNSVYPSKLSITYDAIMGPPAWPLIASAVFIVVCTIWIASHSLYKREIFFGLIFFLITLVPVLQIVPFDNSSPFSDRYFYVPGIGLFVAIAFCVLSVFKKSATQLIMVTFAVALGFVAHERTFVWASDDSLWGDVVNKYPLSHSGLLNKGILLANAGNGAAGEKFMLQALQIKPNYDAAYGELGNYYGSIKKYPEAFDNCKRAYELNPRNFVSLFCMGQISRMMGHYQASIEIFNRMIQKIPNNYLAYYNLGVTYFEMNMWREGTEEFKKVVELNDSYADGHNNLGVGYYHLRAYDKALTEFNRAVQLDPKLESARLNLASIRARSEN